MLPACYGRAMADLNALTRGGAYVCIVVVAVRMVRELARGQSRSDRIRYC